MTDSTAPHASWTERLRLSTDPSSQRSLATKGIVIVAISLVGILVGVVVLLSGQAVTGWVIIALGVLGALIWVVLATNSAASSKLTGDDLIEIVIADEGVLTQGGLPILWSEISGISYTWSEPVSFRGGLTAAAANATAHAMDKAGVDRSMKSLTISLRDYDAVKARATTKMRRLALFAPMLGDPATVHVGFYGRSAEEVHHVLQLLAGASTTHSFAFTRNS